MRVHSTLYLVFKREHKITMKNQKCSQFIRKLNTDRPCVHVDLRATFAAHFEKVSGEYTNISNMKRKHLILWERIQNTLPHVTGASFRSNRHVSQNEDLTIHLIYYFRRCNEVKVEQNRGPPQLLATKDQQYVLSTSTKTCELLKNKRFFGTNA